MLRNAGDGTFGTVIELFGGRGPSSVVIGDFNGDGRADMATANILDNNVSVFLNEGGGSFRPDTLYDAGTRPSSLAVGDFNDDGNPDLAVTNRTDGDLSILLNNGDGSFAAEVGYAAGGEPVATAVGDLDGNGNPDLAVANLADDTVGVLLSRCVAPPAITSQPGPFVVLPDGGGVAEFTVTAVGAEPLIYQWRRDGLPLADGGAVSGTTTPKLTVNATIEDVATYDVVITNDLGEVTSNPVAIAVQQACRADFDGDGELNIFDFLAFQDAFLAGCP